MRTSCRRGRARGAASRRRAARRPRSRGSRATRARRSTAARSAGGPASAPRPRRRRGVCMCSTHDDVVARGVDRAVDHEARRVDRVRRLSRPSRPCEVDLHQARRGDLVEDHPVRVDQEVVLGARHARGDVGEDEVVPAEMRDEAVARGEIDAQCQLFRHAREPNTANSKNPTPPPCWSGAGRADDYPVKQSPSSSGGVMVPRWRSATGDSPNNPLNFASGVSPK